MSFTEGENVVKTEENDRWKHTKTCFFLFLGKSLTNGLLFQWPQKLNAIPLLFTLEIVYKIIHDNEKAGIFTTASFYSHPS